MAFAVLVFLMAAAGSLLLAPKVRHLAWQAGFVDKPDTHRKNQTQPVAFGGGLIIAGSITLAISATILFSSDVQTLFASANKPLIGLLVAALIVVVTGFVDDRFGMRGRHKLFWQIIAAMVAVGSGDMIHSVDILGIYIPIGVFGFAITAIWVLGSINAFNLIDGVDGLAGTVGFVISLALGIISVLRNDLPDAMIAFAMAGSLLGFLYFNWSPATIYLGDAGSMLIGLLLGTIALRCSVKEFATAAAAPMLAIWSILIFDSSAAVLRRKLTGRSIYDCDRGHIHHRLQSKGYNDKQTSIFVGVLCTLTSIAAVASVYYNLPTLGIGMAILVVAGLIATRIFGHIEASLAGKRLVQFGRNSIQPLQRAPKHQSDTTRLQGDLKWEKSWQSVVESAEKLGLSSVRLNLHIARQHEDFFASWKSKNESSEESYGPNSSWSIEKAIIFDGVVYGRIVAAGRQQNSDTQIQFLEFCEELTHQIRTLVKGSSIGINATGVGISAHPNAELTTPA